MTASGSRDISALIDAWGIGPNDVLIHSLPLFHIHGLFVALHTSLLMGAKNLWLPKFEADSVIQCLPRATTFMGVPTYYTRLLAHPGLTKDAVKGMRLFISGSAPLLPDTFNRFRERTFAAVSAPARATVC